jgi:hypothetical protein
MRDDDLAELLDGDSTTTTEALEAVERLPAGIRRASALVIRLHKVLFGADPGLQVDSDRATPDGILPRLRAASQASDTALGELEQKLEAILKKIAE